MDLSSWLWIALFIAFGLGWLFARYDIKSILKKNNKLPIQYFKGLQYILNEQPDKAIDAFIQVAQLDPETADLHLALGQMFRKKGEFTRSIRIHESLAKRGLSKDYQEKAYIALGEDYYRAGMFDRAEKIFNQFTEHKTYKDISIKYLLIIAKLEQDWQKAVKLSDLLPDEQKNKQKFHLQLQYIESIIQLKEFEKARAELNKININQHNHPRFMLVEADLHIQNQNMDLVTERIKNIIYTNTSINYELIFPLLKKIYSNNLKAILNFFDELELSGIDIHKISLVYDFKYKALISILQDKLQKQEDISSSINDINTLLEKELSNCVSLDAIKRYTNFLLEIKKNNSLEQNHIHQIFLLSVNKFLNTDSNIKYICTECGFRARSFSWSCHGCGEWESLSYIADLK